MSASVQYSNAEMDVIHFAMWFRQYRSVSYSLIAQWVNLLKVTNRSESAVRTRCYKEKECFPLPNDLELDTSKPMNTVINEIQKYFNNNLPKEAIDMIKNVIIDKTKVDIVTIPNNESKVSNEIAIFPSIEKFYGMSNEVKVVSVDKIKDCFTRTDKILMTSIALSFISVGLLIFSIFF